ncbi:hypothetical protein EV385_2370 [Krasilnikovia cinnamomea]|uniref:Uncharacterized protein n=1 Tax=Krasilnikovia cinnamomea TaxID=349313 RepID=A0A4Q7ZK07_9ACTN|nr:hypothetical protein [Krasilnikovia cinnamomea]RZU50595.1 hypothetical protein EV385_2370 [Krasilnikovia cinnamomea]
MGSFKDNGNEWPPDGASPDGLPDLPEEWGLIVIPDDLSELADEVAAIQAELHVLPPQTPWQRFTSRPVVRGLRRVAAAGRHAPVLIISMAVLVTVASLFASAWPGPGRAPATQRTAGAGTHTSPQTATGEGDALPALELIGTDGNTVPLRARLPAVLLLTDGCDCARLVADTAAARPDLPVLTVTTGTQPGAALPPAAAPAAPPAGAAPRANGPSVRELRDPTGELRSSLALAAPDGRAAAVLVDDAGKIVRKLEGTSSVDDLKNDLAAL